MVAVVVVAVVVIVVVGLLVGVGWVSGWETIGRREWEHLWGAA